MIPCGGMWTHVVACVGCQSSGWQVVRCAVVTHGSAVGHDRDERGGRLLNGARAARAGPGSACGNLCHTRRGEESNIRW